MSEFEYYSVKVRLVHTSGKSLLKMAYGFKIFFGFLRLLRFFLDFFWICWIFCVDFVDFVDIWDFFWIIGIIGIFWGLLESSWDFLDFLQGKCAEVE